MNLFSKFVLVGLFNTALGYAIIFGCMYILNLSAVASNAIGYTFGLLTSYALNRNFTFKSTAKTRPEILRFLFVFLISYFANLAILIFLIEKIDVHEGLAQLLAGVVYVAASFSMNKYYVFRQPSSP